MYAGHKYFFQTDEAIIILLCCLNKTILGPKVVMCESVANQTGSIFN